MLDYMMDDSRIVATSTGPGQGAVVEIDEERQVVLAQPFFSHFVHRALAAAGRHDAIVENIRKRWAPMLADGDGTLWEHWHGEESRCHAWSATPVYDLSTEVLGVKPLAPGYGAFGSNHIRPGLTGRAASGLRRRVTSGSSGVSRTDSSHSKWSALRRQRGDRASGRDRAERRTGTHRLSCPSR